MGCCISAADHRRSQVEPPPGSPEETVKEVLTETTLPVVAVDGDRRIVKEMAGDNLDRTIDVQGYGSTAEIVPVNGNDEVTVSEASQIYSYGDSNYSNGNPAAAEREEEEEDGVVDQMPPARKRRALSGGRGRGIRGVTAAAEKRGQVAPLRPVRGRTAAAAQLENGRRREEGEGSSWRGEGFVLRRGSEEVDDVVLGDGKRPATDVVSAEEGESLENPIVSLECFIFL